MPDNQNSSECRHDWVTDGVHPTACCRCGIPSSPAPAMLNGVEGLAYARRLAVAIWSRNYREVSPQFEVCDDLLGVLSQIDNMVSGMSAADNRDAAGVDDSEAERYRVAHAAGEAHGRMMAATPTAAPAGEAVAYLDIGAGGYLDLGTEKDDDELFKLPPGRHMLAIAGTFGIDGYRKVDPEAVAAALRFLGELETVGNMKAAEVARDLRKLYTHPPAAEVREVDSVLAERVLDEWQRAMNATLANKYWSRQQIAGMVTALRAALSPPGRAEGDGS